MNYLLEVVDLHKHFGALRAVDGISLGVRAGTCFGLLGPNGAGKTTTIEILEGIQPATSGEIRYRGRPRDRHFAEYSGIQFQSSGLMDSLRVKEVLRLFSRFYRRTMDSATLIRLCQLEELLEREANRLSGGQKQRLLLALALINDPDIVFLDEPTTGLDPQSRRAFWQLIDTVRDRGTTVVLTTHYMDEAETLCDELVIMDHGRIVDQGRPRTLLDHHLPDRRICLRAQALEGIDTRPWQGRIEWRQGDAEISTDAVEQTLQALIALGVDLSSLRVRHPTLEDLFIRLTGHALRD